jgi:2-dehydro-3-deoxyphosphogluconate aldolase/(4S)-4-hydroxy-2-oxoglutarate aldolase
MDEKRTPIWPPTHVTPLIGIVRLSTDASRVAVEALRAGGLELVEVTLTTPGALSAIRELSEAHPRAWIGAGSVVSVEDAERAIAAGAKFLVTPTLDTAVLSAAAARGVPVVCGAYTPTELQSAHAHGAALVKVFPAGALGPGYVRDVLAPLPHLRLAPTGGVTVDNLDAWFGAGAVAVAVGSALVSQQDADAGVWDDVIARTRALVAATRSAVPGEPR